MTPAQFLARVKRSEVPPVCLFLGLEAYNRRRCTDALLASAKAAGVEAERLDAAQTPLAAIVDDVRSMSLFASERLVFIRNAEAAMPRASRSAAASAADDEDGDDAGSSGGGTPGDVGLLEAYLKSPTPGVTVVFEATRWDFEGDDKTKIERVRKYYGAIGEVVEFRRFTVDEARMELDRMARAKNVNLDPAAAQSLVEALAADVGRIAVELEKLSLYGKPVTAEALPLLVPDARQSTIFSLVAALGRRDRAGALSSLDALVREGAMGVQGHFQKAGVPMWGSRAEQVWQTTTKFSKDQLERGLKLIFEADRDLRSARPDDRVIVENFVVRLCG
jgi:DNA polymerase-3 subunit delta